MTFDVSFGQYELDGWGFSARTAPYTSLKMLGVVHAWISPRRAASTTGRASLCLGSPARSVPMKRPASNRTKSCGSLIKGIFPALGDETVEHRQWLEARQRLKGSFFRSVTTRHEPHEEKESSVPLAAVTPWTPGAETPTAAARTARSGCTRPLLRHNLPRQYSTGAPPAR